MYIQERVDGFPYRKSFVNKTKVYMVYIQEGVNEFPYKNYNILNCEFGDLV